MGKLEDNAGSAVIEVRASTNKLSKDLKTAEKKVKRSGKKMSKSVDGVLGSLRGSLLGVAAAAGSTVFAFQRIVNGVDAIAKSARRFGFGVEAFQEFALAAELSGSGMQELETSMGQFTRKLSDAENGTIRTVDAFKRLQALSGQQVEFDTRQTAFFGTLKALSKISDETARAQIALELMGARAAQRLLPLIANFDKATAQAKELNATVSKDTTEVFEDLKDQVTILATVSFAGLAESLAPIASDIATMAKDAAKLTAAFNGWKSSFKGANDELAKIRPTMAKISKIVGTITGGLLGGDFFADIISDKQLDNLKKFNNLSEKELDILKDKNDELAKRLKADQVDQKPDKIGIPEEGKKPIVGLEDIIGRTAPKKEIQLTISQQDILDTRDDIRGIAKDAFGNLGNNIREGNLQEALQETALTMFDRFEQQTFDAFFEQTFGAAFNKAFPRDQMEKQMREATEQGLETGAEGADFTDMFSALGKGLSDVFTAASDKFAGFLETILGGVQSGVTGKLINFGDGGDSTTPVSGANASGGATGIGLSGKAFAKGGEPPVGQASLVGEEGMELFVPKTAGTIIPNNALKSMGGTTIVNQTISVTPDVPTQVQQQIFKSLPMISSAVIDANNESNKRGRRQ